MECKHESVNIRKVSDTRRAFRLAFGVTGSPDDLFSSVMGMIVMTLGPNRRAFVMDCSTAELPGSINQWAGSPPQHAGEHLKSVKYSLRNSTSSLETLLVRQEIIATPYHSMIFKTYVLSSLYQ